jgi:hypothetical protein
LSGQVRLTLHGISAQVDELQREFPEDGSRVQAMLDELQDIGNRLEAALWESGGLPLTGWMSRWRFFCRRLLKGLGRRRLVRPLLSKLRAGNSAETVDAFATLFGGLSLCPAEKLTVAEGALLWRSFGDERGISTVALNTLLTHRFVQFQGEQVQLDELQTLQTVKGRPHELLMQNGQTCSASFFLLGSQMANNLLPPELRSSDPVPASPPLQARITAGAASPLLAQVIILGGMPPLRLTLVADSATSQSRIICQAVAPSEGLTADQLTERLAALLPFATLRFEPSAEPMGTATASARRQKTFPGAVRSLVIKKNLINCCGEQVLPTLGATGEVLVGVSVFNHLQRQKRS